MRTDRTPTQHSVPAHTPLQIPEPDRTSFNLCPLFPPYLLYRLIRLSPLRSSLPFSLFLYIYPSFPPSSSHPPLASLCWNNRNCFPVFFSPLGYLDRGGGWWVGSFYLRAGHRGHFVLDEGSEGRREGEEKEREWGGGGGLKGGQECNRYR